MFFNKEQLEKNANDSPAILKEIANFVCDANDDQIEFVKQCFYSCLIISLCN